MKLTERQESAIRELLAAFGVNRDAFIKNEDPRWDYRTVLVEYLLGTSLPITSAMQIFGITGDAPKIIEEIRDHAVRSSDGVWRAPAKADAGSV